MQIYYILSKTDIRQALSHTSTHGTAVRSVQFLISSAVNAVSQYSEPCHLFIWFNLILLHIHSSAHPSSHLWEMNLSLELVHCVPRAQNSYNPNHAIFLNFLDFMLQFFFLLCFSHATCEFVHMLAFQRIYLIIFQFYS